MKLVKFALHSWSKLFISGKAKAYGNLILNTANFGSDSFTKNIRHLQAVSLENEKLHVYAYKAEMSHEVMKTAVLYSKRKGKQ